MRFPILNTSFDRMASIEASTPREAFRIYFAQPRTQDNANFSSAYLAEITINLFRSYGPRFDGAFLDLTLFKNCELERAQFRNASLVDTTFETGALYRAIFDECDMRGVKFDGTNLSNVIFRKCTFSASFNYRYAINQGARFEQCTGLVVPPEEHEIEGI